MTFSFNADREQLQEIQQFPHLLHPSAGETTLYLVRHGQTIANTSHRLAGTTDVPLDELGELQAKEMASRIAALQFDALVASPLIRARRTAEAIASHTGHALQLEHDLREMDFGVAENLTIDEALQVHPGIQKLLDDADNPDLGWPGGETRRQFDDRVFNAFGQLMSTYAGGTAVVVAHGGVIGSFFARIIGGNPRDFARFAVANCSVTQVRITSACSEVHCWNDISHLSNVETIPFQLKVSK